MSLNNNKNVLFFDIPLLFEKNIYMNYDYIIYTTVDFYTRKERVLKREGMTLDKFKQICMNQPELSQIQKKSISLEIDTKLNINQIEEKFRIIISSIIKYET